MTRSTNIARKTAAELIDRIHATVTLWNLGDVTSDEAAAKIHELLTEVLPPLRECEGAAHGLFVEADNCGVCAPRWGVVGPAVRIR